MRTGWSSLKIIFTHYRVDINYTPETGEPFCDQKDSQLLSPLAGKQEKLTIDENKEKPAKLLNFSHLWAGRSVAWWECQWPQVRECRHLPQFSPRAFTNCTGPKTGCRAAGEDAVHYKGTPEALWRLGVGKQSRKPKAQLESKQKAGNWVWKQSKLFQGLGKLAAGLQNIGFSTKYRGVPTLCWAPCWMQSLLKKRARGLTRSLRNLTGAQTPNSAGR